MSDADEAMDRLAERLLRESVTIAVVGLSQHEEKAAHRVPALMQAAGYRVIGVHPTAETLLGEPAYRSLADIPEPIDVVDVFRPSPEGAGVTAQAAAIGAKAVWLQLGIVSDEARRIAADAGMDYVEDRCMAVVLRALGPSPRG